MSPFCTAEDLALSETISRFAAETIAPEAARIDRDEIFAGCHLPALAEIGLTGEGVATAPVTAPVAHLTWPADLPAQVAAVRNLIPTAGVDSEAIAACFGRKNKKRADQIAAILATLKALGHIT